MRCCDYEGKNIKKRPLKNSHHITSEEIQEEQKIITAAKKDIRKFGALYDRYYEGIFNFVYRRSDDEAVAADLVSQTFLKAMQGLKKYEFRGLPFSAWLYRIASNEVNKHYRKGKRQQVFSLEEGRVLELMESDGEGADEEQLAMAVQLLKALPTDMMEVLELRFFEEKSFKEIAYILDISESGAKMRTYRALEKLKSSLKGKID